MTEGNAGRSPLDLWADRASTAQRNELERAAVALRRLLNHLHETDADGYELAPLADQLEALAELAAELPVRVAPSSPADQFVDPEHLSFADVSPMSGPGSGMAPPLRLSVDGNSVVGVVTFGEAFEGPPGHVHGGWIAAAFDEVQGMVQALNETPGMTATLGVQYRQPTPLHVELTFRARVRRVSGRHIHTSATLHHGELLLCESQGLFIAVDFDKIRAMAAANQS